MARLLSKKRNSAPPMEQPVVPEAPTNSNSPGARSYLRHCLDVINLLLIGAYVFKACTDIQPCSIATVVEKETLAIAPQGVQAVEETSSNLRATAVVQANEPPAPILSSDNAVAVDGEPEERYEIPIDYRRFLSDGQTVVVVMASSGLGSNIIQILAQKLFYNDRKFNFIVDDTQYGYKWNDEIGLMRGFFDPHFPVLKRGEYEREIQQGQNMPGWDVIQSNSAFKVARSADTRILVQWAINESFRANFQNNYGTDGVALYDRFVAEACTNLQFSNRAKRAILELTQANNIPDLRKTHSVAFHVRRGDKVALGESRAFAGSEYVSKLIQLRDRKWIEHTKPIEHCFVASDDLGAVEEVRQELIRNGFECQFHTLATRSEGQAGTAKAAYNERESTVQFLAEFSLLLDASYFIGSFNSNVGSLAAILRKCHHYGAPHYAHSYGVDQEGWFYRA